MTIKAFALLLGFLGGTFYLVRKTFPFNGRKKGK